MPALKKKMIDPRTDLHDPPGSNLFTDKDHVKPFVLGPSASLVMGSRYYGIDNAGSSH